jgi:hypothetical protein
MYRPFAEHLRRYPIVHGLLVGWLYGSLVARFAGPRKALACWGGLLTVLVIAAKWADRG